MHAYRKYRVLVNLTADQKLEIRRLGDGQRAAYNWAVSEIKNGWDARNEYGLYNELTKQRAGHDHLRAVPVAVQRAGIQDAFKAAKLSAQYGRGGLKYRARKRSRNGALKCSLPPKVVDSHLLKLPVFGTVRAKIPCEIPEHEPKSYEFAMTRSGRYVLYVSCLVTLLPPKGPGVTVKGIDRGTVEPTVAVTLSPDGSRPLASDSYDTASAFRQNRRWNSQMQRKASKMNKRSNRYKEHLRRMNARMRKVLDRRTYAECIAAKEICTTSRPHTIVMENLKVSGMTRHGGSHKRGMNREMRFVRHHAIEQRIKNRAEIEGIQLLHVNPRYTSQTCSRCGHADKDSRITRDMFKCVKCSYTQQADVNAAINVGRGGLPSFDHAIAVPPEAGTAFVRRELDAHCGKFLPQARMGRENQVLVHSLPPSRMEKQRQKLRGRQVINWQ